MSGRQPDGHDEPVRSEDVLDPLVIDLDPGDPFQGKQMIVGTDPWLEDYLRSPYDLFVGALAAARLTGEVVRRPPKRGWMRPIAYVIAFLLLAGGAFGTGLAGMAGFFGGGSALALNSEWLWSDRLRTALVSIPGMIAGALLLWRLMRT